MLPTAFALIVGLDQPENALRPEANRLLVVLKQFRLLEHVAALGAAPSDLKSAVSSNSMKTSNSHLHVNGVSNAAILLRQFCLQVRQFQSILCEFAVLLALRHVHQNLLGHQFRDLQRLHRRAIKGWVVKQRRETFRKWALQKTFHATVPGCPS